MDYTKVIEDLCAVIDRMNVIIQAQAMELAQHGAVAHAEEIAAVRQQYVRAIGSGPSVRGWDLEPGRNGRETDRGGTAE